MHVNGRAAAKVIKSYQTSAVTLSSWGLFYRPAPWLCNIAAFSLMSWSLVVRLCFQGNLAIERLATSKLFPQLSRYCTEMAGRLAFKAYYKNPQQPAYSKDIMWRRPSVSRAKLNKNGRCGKTNIQVINKPKRSSHIGGSLILKHSRQLFYMQMFAVGRAFS